MQNTVSNGTMSLCRRALFRLFQSYTGKKQDVYYQRHKQHTSQYQRYFIDGINLNEINKDVVNHNGNYKLTTSKRSNMYVRLH